MFKNPVMFRAWLIFSTPVNASALVPLIVTVPVPFRLIVPAPAKLEPEKV